MRDIIQRLFQHIEDDGVTPADRTKMIEESHEEELEEKAFDQGKEKGIELGKEQGIELGKQETARKMLAKGMDREMIAELTGLSVDVIAGLS